MARLEDITPGVSLKGLLPNATVVVSGVKWFGDDVVEVTYKTPDGKVANELVFKDQAPSIDVVERGRAWSFDGDPELLRLVSEAYRIRLAYLFDPLVAVHTSTVQPLPHQIMAVYGEMLRRQPLRFLLADDPGAGKTVMAGLLIKELIVRGDLSRCLIVCPGSLAEQWQDELRDKFGLHFEILTNDRIAASPTGNVFSEMPLMIARLDKLSRDDEIVEKLRVSSWDLIVCDEAHKMSASFFGGEKKETRRYKLGKELSQVTRHFLLMSATPHNGKEEDFQLFMALLDGDRFEGKFRDGVHASDSRDMMRRMIKEDLVKFDGKPLFPERIAYTVTYPLSDLEADLYERVTAYVREEFNRAEALTKDGRKGTVGFALTVLQRRLASSPYAIYQSLKRRRERLEKMVREEQFLKHGRDIGTVINSQLDDIDEDELEDIPGDEREQVEEQVVDQATAARTIEELKAEIETLKNLEDIAHRVVASKTDRKWEELSKLMQGNPEMFDKSTGRRRKLVIFTEMRDTLDYLSRNLRLLLGSGEAVVEIHGGMAREDRLNAQHQFKNLSSVEVLLATDAAGEGINLQQSHLMVNYDLPWNPNRLEQRFGRVHRIGQSEVCHLWNIVAENTREGEVYQTLLRKLEIERAALGGKVFDVLGRAIAGAELRSLLIDAIRYNDKPEVRARLDQVVARLDTENIRRLLDQDALARDSMDASRVQSIRDDMERAEARKLQPFFIAQFFISAFHHFGGRISKREAARFEISNVPSIVRQRDKQIGRRAALLPKYERVTFDKNLISPPGAAVAEFVCPGHPLLDAVIDITLEKYRESLKQGAILIDDSESEAEPRVLVYLEHSIQDGRLDAAGVRRTVSRRFEFVELTRSGDIRAAGYAPYLNYRSPSIEESQLAKTLLAEDWLNSDIEQRALSFAIKEMVPRHLAEVRSNKEELIDKTIVAVKERLLQEINYWDNRGYQLRLDEDAGKANAKINSAKASQRADELRVRLTKRTNELELEKRISPLPPVVVGGALIIPKSLVGPMADNERDVSMHAKETKFIEIMAMKAVTAIENHLGHTPEDVSRNKCGWDVESRDGMSGRLRFIEVKGRIEGSSTVTVTKNEILAGLNKREQFILAVVIVPLGATEDDLSKCTVRYLEAPFNQEPDFAVTSVNFDLGNLWLKGINPYAAN